MDTQIALRALARRLSGGLAITVLAVVLVACGRSNKPVGPDDEAASAVAATDELQMPGDPTMPGERRGDGAEPSAGGESVGAPSAAVPAALPVAPAAPAASDAVNRELRAEIAAANRMCPIKVVDGFSITAIALEGHDLLYQYDIDDEALMIQPDALQQQKETIRQNLLATIEQPGSAYRELYEKVAAAGYGIKLVMNFTSAGKRLTTRITNAEMKKRLASKISAAENNRRQLLANIEMANAQCPQQVDEQTVLTAVTLEGSRAVYHYTVDEGALGVNVAGLATASSTMKDAIRNNMTGNMRAVMAPFIRLLIANGTKLVYRYKGDTSGEHMDIVFTVDELRAL